MQPRFSGSRASVGLLLAYVGGTSTFLNDIILAALVVAVSLHALYHVFVSVRPLARASFCVFSVGVQQAVRVTVAGSAA